MLAAGVPDGAFGQGGFSGNSPWAGRDGSPGVDAAAGRDASTDLGAVDAAIFNCPEVPAAYVFERTTRTRMWWGTRRSC